MTAPAVTGQPAGRPHYQLIIGGAHAEAASGQRYESVDPFLGAGWATAAGQFVILTWGSSTCIPVIQDVKATGATQVTVTFAAQEAAKICTADMAPQAQVTAVNGLEQSTGITAILTGGGFNNVKIPIYGASS